MFCIQILCIHCTNNNPCWRVLVCLHAVGGSAEDGRLVHVQHVDLHCGRVFIGAHVEEARVQVSIGCFHFKTVGLSDLIVQWLHTRRNTEDGPLSKPNQTFLQNSVKISKVAPYSYAYTHHSTECEEKMIFLS